MSDSALCESSSEESIWSGNLKSDQIEAWIKTILRSERQRAEIGCATATGSLLPGEVDLLLAPEKEHRGVIEHAIHIYSLSCRSHFPIEQHSESLF